MAITALDDAGLRMLEPAPMPFSVMCIDDNVLLIDALERRLDLEPGFTGLFRVDDFSQSVDAVRRHHPSVVLLDFDLPGGVDAIAILADLVVQTPQSRVIVFTGYPSGELVARSMSRGAWGFISKGISSRRLIDAILSVVGGQAVIELDE